MKSFGDEPCEQFKSLIFNKDRREDSAYEPKGTDLSMSGIVTLVHPDVIHESLWF